MKRQLITALAALTCTFGVIAGASAQTATFSFNDLVGTPNAGSYGPGQSFSFNVFLNFAPGGAIANLEGLSYWFQQSPGSGAFSIINRDFTGSMFTDAQTPSMTYPQTLSPSNGSDLGALLPVGIPALGAGNYFIARITIAISATAANGVYSLANVIAGPQTSMVADSAGHTFAIAQSTYQATVAPDSGSTALLLGLSFLGLVGLLRCQQRSKVAVLA